MPLRNVDAFLYEIQSSATFSIKKNKNVSSENKD